MDKSDKICNEDLLSHQEMWELMQSIKSTINRLDVIDANITVLETRDSDTVNLSADVKTLQNNVSLLCTKLTRNEINVSRFSRDVV
ncbi:hypothetical protein LSH36_2580g00000 [Paralvinella palmiformis]|uniref:Uncharacterized protein n=1 Tax=Paralvinella palmiformis TaxID=53620 RepID=A0AAD9IRH1_9ANNE|nr:hypothetical protein LSH36_2580g00000 [Paralvinella palmiformis]